MKKVLKMKDTNLLVEVLLEENILGDERVEIIQERTEDATTEKHVPYIEEKEDGYLVKVGKETAHPMVEAHYIQFIELWVDEFLYRKYLKPTEAPEVYFKVPKGKNVVAREYCNLHGLWRS